MINLQLRKVAANAEPDDSERQTDVSSFSQMRWWRIWLERNRLGCPI